MNEMTYETPLVTDHGTLTELTAATKIGERTDASFPDDTPLTVILNNLS